MNITESINTDHPKDKLKMWFCVRTDLNMRKGKIAAQCAHGVIDNILPGLAAVANIIPVGTSPHCSVELSPEVIDWYRSGQTKIVIGANSEEHLLILQHAAAQLGIPAVIITDNGLTEFHGVKTLTVCVIGPCQESEIWEVIGNLKLL